MQRFALQTVFDYIIKRRTSAPADVKPKLDFRARLLVDMILSTNSRARLLWLIAGLENHHDPQAINAMLAPSATAASAPAYRERWLGKLPAVASLQCAGMLHVHISGELAFRDFGGLVDSIKAAEAVSFTINSIGGDSKLALAFADALRGKESVALADGFAFSAACTLMQACRRRQMTSGSRLLIHAPHRFVVGRPDDLRAAADALERDSEPVIALHHRADDEVRRWLIGSEDGWTR